MIKSIVMALGLGMSCAAFAADTSLPSFDMQAAQLSQVVSLYYKEVAKKPYVMCDEVLKDARLVSVRASGKVLDAAMVSALLESNGYEAREDHGLTVVCTKARQSEAELGEPMFYRPQYRDTAYLVDLLAPLVKGTFANKRSAVPALAVGGEKVTVGTAMGSVAVPAAAQQAQPAAASTYKPGTGDDYLLFNGTEKEQAKLRKLLAQVDIPTGEVVIKGYVYEVGKNNSEASALDLLASLLKGKLELSIAGPVLGNALRIKAGGIDLVASALNSDGRFKVVTSPFTRVRSGATARFQVGADVPVLGSILTNANGQAQQSVEYRSAGTLLEVSPKVRDKSTDVDLFQQISSFVTTETGVNNSPTLNKREIRTSLTVEDGEVLVIGGLNDLKEEETKSGLWFLPFATSKSSGTRSTELLLILELKRI